LFQANFDKGFIEKEITLEDESSVIYSPQLKECFGLVEDRPGLFSNQKLEKDPFKDFSFYSNINDPYVKYLDSILASDNEDSEDLEPGQLSNKLNKSDGEIIGQNDLAYHSTFKSEKAPHGTVPKFKLPISQVCQENYEEEPLEGPFSAKELSSYTTQPIKPLKGTGTIHLATSTQTQTSIVLNERVKGKHKHTLSCDANIKFLVPSTAASSLQLLASGVFSNQSLPKSMSNTTKESTSRQRIERPPENGIQIEKINDSLNLDEFDGIAVNSYRSVKELPRLGALKKPSSYVIN